MKDWILIESDVRRLHQDRRTLRQIIAGIKVIWPGFDASERAWKSKLKQWDLARPRMHRISKSSTPKAIVVEDDDDNEDSENSYPSPAPSKTTHEPQDLPQHSYAVTTDLTIPTRGSRRGDIVSYHTLCTPCASDAGTELFDRHKRSLDMMPDFSTSEQEESEPVHREALQNAYRYTCAGMAHAGTCPFHWLTCSSGEAAYLHYTARRNSESVLREALDRLKHRGMPLSQLVDGNGWNAVFYAIYANKPFNVKRLLLADGTLALANCHGDNALHFAIMQCASKNICKMLLEHGVDMRERNASGFSCVELAAAYGRKDLLHLMIVKGRPKGWDGSERVRFKEVLANHDYQYTFEELSGLLYAMV